MGTVVIILNIQDRARKVCHASYGADNLVKASETCRGDRSSLPAACWYLATLFADCNGNHTWHNTAMHVANIGIDNMDAARNYVAISTIAVATVHENGQHI